MEIDNRLEDALDHLFPVDKTNYGNAKSVLLAADAVIRHWMAKSIQPSLQKQIDETNVSALIAKKRLSTWINAELEWFRLAVQCPKTGGPSRLEAIYRAHKPDEGVFRFESLNADCSRKSARSYADDLHQLVIVPDTFERRYLARTKRSNESQR